MQLIGVGSASGRLNYQCGKCGAKHIGKNAAAMALGALGGKARAESLTPEERKAIGSKAIQARWDKKKQQQ